MINKISTLILATVLLAGIAHAADSDKKAMTLEDRVSELEANQSLNIFKFSGLYETRFDDIAVKQDKGATTPYDYKDLKYLRMRFSLNVDADVSKYVKFYSRYTMTKHFNAFVQQGTASTSNTDLSSGNNYQDSSVQVEKAYADFSMPGTNLVLSVGRLPTYDGEPTNYWDGRAKMGAYPLLSYNSILDGFALTYRLNDYMPQDQSLTAKLVYTPFSQYYQGVAGAGGITTPPTQDTSAAGAQTGNRINTLVDFTAVQLDYENSAVGFMDSLGFVAQYYTGGNLAIQTGQYSSTASIALQGTTGALELSGIGHTGFDLSLSYLQTKLHSKGGVGGYGFGTASADDTITGGVSLVSARYRLMSWILGAEYQNGSKNSAYFAGEERDLTSFYGTRGQGYHFYVTEKFTENLALRIGYMQQNYKWNPAAIGPATDSDKKIGTAYANMRLDF